MALLNREIVVHSTPWSIDYWSADWTPRCVKTSYVLMCQAELLGRPTSIQESQSLASPVNKNAGIVYELACLPSATRPFHIEIVPAIERQQVSMGMRTFNAARLSPPSARSRTSC